MSDTPKSLHDTLADITSVVRDIVTLLSDPNHWQQVDGVDALQLEFGNSAAQLATLRKRFDAMESRLVDLGLRIENVIETGPESIRDSMCDGMECVRDAQTDVRSVRARWRESDPNDHVFQVRGLFKELKIEVRPKKQEDDVELEFIAANAATLAAELLPTHGDILGEWASRLDYTMQAIAPPSESVSREQLRQRIEETFQVTSSAAQMRIKRGIEKGHLKKDSHGGFLVRSVEGFLKEQKCGRAGNQDPFEIEDIP
jgi:hypothetical protein